MTIIARRQSVWVLLQLVLENSVIDSKIIPQQQSEVDSNNKRETFTILSDSHNTAHKEKQRYQKKCWGAVGKIVSNLYNCFAFVLVMFLSEMYIP